MIVTIDGPAGSGKSSTAKAIAKKLQIGFIDSGALYRIATLIYLNSDGQQEFFEKLKEADIEIEFSSSGFQAWLNNSDVTKEIRTQRVSENVSNVAVMEQVRNRVNKELREIAENGKYIADGRDLGTVVYPDADLKIFMVADAEVRAQRRFDEQQAAGEDVAFEHVLSNIKERDQIDSNRAIAPLKKADDAVELNTSNMDFDDQVEAIINLIREKTEILN